MKKINHIYFPIYENIEKEVLNLTSAIHFTDDQINVYSTNIADLIVRCSNELESIAKDLYRRENDLEPESSGQCFNWMEEHWRISKKRLIIVSPYFHFDKILKPNFCPFDYKKGSLLLSI